MAVMSEEYTIRKYLQAGEFFPNKKIVLLFYSSNMVVAFKLDAVHNFELRVFPFIKRYHL